MTQERPILFSAPTVRALLDGSKTQTRRVLTRHNSRVDGHRASAAMHHDLDFAQAWVDEGPSPAGNAGPYLKAPRPSTETVHRVYAIYAPGDRLFIRENGWERPERTRKMMREGADTWSRYYYDADGLLDSEVDDFRAWGFKRRASIHMPRWASRILLEVTDVRVERLQDISQADARAEGAPPSHPSIDKVSREFGHPDFSRSWYAQLWDQINGAGAWEANPWVWAVTFKKVTP